MYKILGIYLFALALLIGVEVSIGTLIAPTIFFPQAILGDGVLSHFQSGQLMTAIFLKYNTALMVISILSLLYEMVNFNNNRAESFNLKFSTLMLSLINLSLACVFVLYFTDYIVETQKLGAEATQSETFAKIHGASEWCMKIMMIAQTILFFIRFPRKTKS